MGRTIKWELSQRCNLSCKHCFVGKVEYEKELPIEQNKKIIDILLKHNVTDIMFSSKEPLLYPSFYELIQYCRTNGITISIITNGTLFDKKIIEELGRNIVKVISFSLEGISPNTNDFIRGESVFNKVMETVNQLDEIGKKNKRIIPLALQISLTSINKHESKMMHQFFQDSPFLMVNIGDIAIIGSAEDNEYIKATMDEHNDMISSILESYAKEENPNYILHLKSLNVYETIRHNTQHNICLDIVVPSCSVHHGYYSILPNGTLCSCVALKGVEGIESNMNIYSDNILLTNDFKPERGVVEKKKYRQNAFCIACKYYEKCEFCYLASTKEQIEYVQGCERSVKKLKKIAQQIIEGEVEFKFNQFSYIQLVDEQLTIKKHYLNNQTVEVWITDYESINYYKEIYKRDQWVQFNPVHKKSQVEKWIESLLFSDMLTIKTM